MSAPSAIGTSTAAVTSSHRSLDDGLDSAVSVGSFREVRAMLKRMTTR